MMALAAMDATFTSVPHSQSLSLTPRNTAVEEFWEDHNLGAHTLSPSTTCHIWLSIDNPMVDNGDTSPHHDSCWPVDLVAFCNEITWTGAIFSAFIYTLVPSPMQIASPQPTTMASQWMMTMLLMTLAVDNQQLMIMTIPSNTLFNASPWTFLPSSERYNNSQTMCKHSSNHCLHQPVIQCAATTPMNLMDDQTHYCHQMAQQQQNNWSIITLNLLLWVNTPICLHTATCYIQTCLMYCFALTDFPHPQLPMQQHMPTMTSQY